MDHLCKCSPSRLPWIDKENRRLQKHQYAEPTMYGKGPSTCEQMTLVESLSSAICLLVWAEKNLNTLSTTPIILRTLVTAVTLLQQD